MDRGAWPEPQPQRNATIFRTNALNIFRSKNADQASDNFPVATWSKISLEMDTTLTLYGRLNRGHLEVRLHNHSDQTLEPDSDGQLSYSFIMLDAKGHKLSGESIRTPLSSSVAPGACHSQKVTVIIPQEQMKHTAAIRVGLLKEGKYWVEDLCPQHSRIVQIAPAPALSPAEMKLAIASQIWPKRQSNGLRWPYGSMMVSEAHRLFYIPVAKCACTSLKSMMVKLAAVDRPDIVTELGVHLVTDRFNTGVQLKDKPIERAREILASDQYFKFSVIRDPFQRLVSAYLEKFVYKRHNDRNLLHTRAVISAAQGTQDIDLDQGISFDDFLAYILSQDPFELDPHWRPQHHYFLGVPHMSRIFRLENIKALEEYLLRDQGITIKLGHDNKTGKSDIHLQQASSLPACELDRAGPINPDSFLATGHAKAVREYYREDFAFYDSAV